MRKLSTCGVNWKTYILEIQLELFLTFQGAVLIAGDVYIKCFSNCLGRLERYKQKRYQLLKTLLYRATLRYVFNPELISVS